MNAREEVETRLGVQPIEQLHAIRDELVKRVKVIRALHGAFGLREAKRKILLATIKMACRAKMQVAGVRPTDAGVDDMGHANPAYVEWITTAVLEASELHVLENKIQNIADLIDRDKGIMYRTGQEARLT